MLHISLHTRPECEGGLGDEEGSGTRRCRILFLPSSLAYGDVRTCARYTHAPARIIAGQGFGIGWLKKLRGTIGLFNAAAMMSSRSPRPVRGLVSSNWRPCAVSRSPL
jgi:hypothetical protein